MLHKLKRIIFSIFGKPQYSISRNDFWWCEELKMWYQGNPWQEGTEFAKYNWSNWRYTSSTKEAFKDFGECVDKGMRCTMEEDRIFLNRRICLWDYVAEEQKDFGGKK